ncbi:MAG: hypothetical protein K9G83_11840, partial [Hyphomonadaceae bacterium]|nr:hypothetical protein [Hyphomonadaceae bacterium]
MLHKSGSDATPLLEQLAALGIAAVRLGQDDAVGEANELFFQLTGISPEAIIGQRLADVLESSAVEHNAYGRDAAVYRFATPRGDRWLKPRWGRGPVEGVVTLSDVSSEWSMLGKLVATIEVRDRLMRDADIGVFRYNPDDGTLQFSEALVRRGEELPGYHIPDVVK